jgi:hypothetical protein
MKRSILACLTVAVVFGCSVASVKADDIYPPWWLRGQPNTTYQDWTFSTSQSMFVAPDSGFYNPNGTPTAFISNGQWSMFYDNHVGVWTLPVGTNGVIALNVPNTEEDNPYKWVWTQVTWQSDNGGSPVVLVDGEQSRLELVTPVGNGGWMQSVYMSLLSPNPSSEQVLIMGTVDVGQVVIDTICIPEPSTLALLAAGAAALMVSRRRK